MASRRNPGLLYVLDDGPGTSALLVVRARNARPLGMLEIAGLSGTDTEALALGPCRARAAAACIYIGDIGDNAGARDSITVTRVAEPELAGDVPGTPIEGDTVVLEYPDGPHDAEALLVGSDGSLAVITKAAGRHGRGAARVYVSEGFADGTLRDAGGLRLPQPSLPLAAAVVGNVVTGADATAGRVAVRTYDAIYELTAPRRGAPLRTLPAWSVHEIAAAAEPQGEAIAYGADGCSLFTVSEDSGRLHAIRCR